MAVGFHDTPVAQCYLDIYMGEVVLNTLNVCKMEYSLMRMMKTVGASTNQLYLMSHSKQSAVSQWMLLTKPRYSIFKKSG